MSRFVTFVIFLIAVFLQAGAYGLTFLLPRLFERFGADEKAVGITLAISTWWTKTDWHSALNNWKARSTSPISFL